MKQNNVDIRKLKENQMYEYFKSLSLEKQAEALEEIMNNIDDYKDDIYFIENLNNVTQRLKEDLILREKYYWNIYYLIDDDENLTKLGEFYELLFTHHYIKALKLYLTFTKALHNKNKVLYKNEKANEYLNHFGRFVKSKNNDKVLKKKI